MADIDPRLLQMLAKALGPRLTPQHIEGFLMGQGLQSVSKGFKTAQPQQPGAMPQPGMPTGAPQQAPPPGQPPQPRQPPQPQAGGQVTINKQVAGAGPLRSGTSPQQLQALAALLADQQIAQQLAALPMMAARGRSPAPGIPGVPGPTVQ